MPIGRLDDIRKVAQKHCTIARQAALALGLVKLTENVHKYAKAYSLGGRRKYRRVKVCHGIKAWGAVLSVDIRKSTERAIRDGAGPTFVTMHTFMPTMVKVVRKAKGHVVGLRGDGLFAAFGLVELGAEETDKKVTPKEAGEAVLCAARCGHAMIQVVQEVVNPLLGENGFPDDLSIGVGIDVGTIVATNIGLADARELTAYGEAVNGAWKLAFGNDAVMTSTLGNVWYPESKGGTARVVRYPGRAGVWVIKFDKNNPMLV